VRFLERTGDVFPLYTEGLPRNLSRTEPMNRSLLPSLPKEEKGRGEEGFLLRFMEKAG
jgi:hypothetical protein